MASLFKGEKKDIRDRRRENKKCSDLLKKNSFRQEVSFVYSKFYHDQVAALYRRIHQGT